MMLAKFKILDRYLPDISSLFEMMLAKFKILDRYLPDISSLFEIYKYIK
jgi:hypothetical protein